MTLEEIENEIASLPLLERKELERWLRMQNRADKPYSIEGRAQELFGKIERVVGQPVLNRSRRYPLPLYRYMVIKALADEGNSIVNISKATGMDRATIYYGISEIEDIIAHPFLEKGIADIWKQFKKEI